MKLFDKKYAHFTWSSELKDKECFVSDTIFGIRDAVENNRKNSKSKVTFSEDEDYEFLDADERAWQFCYYDPHYDIKVAFNKGKTIQFRESAGDNWHDIVAAEPLWHDDWEYRIKPEAPKSYDVSPRFPCLNSVVRILDNTNRLGVVTGYDPVNDKYFVLGEWYTLSCFTIVGGTSDNTRVGDNV